MAQHPVWKTISPKEYFKDIHIPNDWNSLEEFVDWWVESKMPLMIPFNAEVIRSDDAVAICLFRKNQYQVELYLEFPQMIIQRHSHPNMEVIIMDLGGGSLSPSTDYGVGKKWGVLEEKVMPGTEHGGDYIPTLGNGKCFLAFEKWYDSKEMTSAAVQWKGTTAGPIQENLIRSKKKDAHVTHGYADVSIKSKDA